MTQGSASQSDTRKQLRDNIFNHPDTQAKKIVVPFYGNTIELHQPTLEDIMSARETGTPTYDPETGEEIIEASSTSIAQMLIDYAYVPGTDLKVFEQGDKDRLMKLPFGRDLRKVSEAFNQLTDLGTEEAEKNSEETPSNGT